MIYENVFDLVGNTPLLKIPESVHGLKNIDLYAKLEYYNPFGSVKDRVAKSMLTPLLPELEKTGKTVLEASSGNTAKALCGLAGVKSLPFKTVTNRIKVPEVRMMLQVLGAEIEELPGLSDCPDPMDPNDYTTVAQNMAKGEPDKYHYTDQYFNELNLKGHEETAHEILRDLHHIDYYIGCLGTCGSTMGAGKVLRDANPNIKVIGVVADAGHHLPGGRNMNELWEVGFFNHDFYDDLLKGTTQEAMEAMLTLNRKCGIMCGPTTGLTFHATLKKLKEVDSTLTERKTAVFIACDRIEPYMTYIKRYKPELFSTDTTERKTIESQDVEDILNSAEITSEELKALQDKEEPIIIDIRGYFSFTVGHIKGSINIMSESFSLLIEEGEIFPKEKLIIVVCPNGSISRKFASFLESQGYTAASLKHGILDWKTKGFELKQTLKKSEEKVLTC